MKQSIFNYLDYRDYLLEKFKSEAKGGYGLKSKLAAQLNCDTGFVSKVFGGKNNFSGEQALIIADFLGLNEAETHFLVLLVEYERSGTKQLKSFYQKQIKQLQEKWLNVSSQIAAKKTLSKADQAIYYSNWIYTAIHTALNVSTLRTVSGLAKYFNLETKKITATLEELIKMGLIKQVQNEYLPAEMNIHLESDSSMIEKHHTNWRLQAIRSLDYYKEEHLHYSSVISISKKEALLLRDELVNAIKKSREIVRPAKDEDIYCYNLDLFPLTDK